MNPLLSTSTPSFYTAFILPFGPTFLLLKSPLLKEDILTLWFMNSFVEAVTFIKKKFTGFFVLFCCFSCTKRAINEVERLGI